MQPLQTPLQQANIEGNICVSTVEINSISLLPETEIGILACGVAKGSGLLNEVVKSNFSNVEVL